MKGKTFIEDFLVSGMINIPTPGFVRRVNKNFR